MSPRSGLESALAQLVRDVGWSSERVSRSFAAQQALHPTDLRALAAIFQADSAGHPLTLRALAAELDLTPAAVTYAVDRLTDAGHVFRERSQADRRTVFLRFAEHGRRVARDFFTPLGAIHTGALESFTDADLATAVQVLAVIKDALDDFETALRRQDADGADR